MIPNCSSIRMTHEWDVFCLVARPDGSTQSKRRGSTTKGPAGKTNPNDLLPRIDHKSSRCRGQEPHAALSPRHQHHGDFAAQQRRPKRNGDFTCPTALKPRYAAFQDVRVHGCWDASGHHPSNTTQIGSILVGPTPSTHNTRGQRHMAMQETGPSTRRLVEPARPSTTSHRAWRSFSSRQQTCATGSRRFRRWPPHVNSVSLPRWLVSPARWLLPSLPPKATVLLTSVSLPRSNVPASRQAMAGAAALHGDQWGQEETRETQEV